MRKKDWLKFLRIIFYFLAIISLALSIMGKMARAAESLPDNIEDLLRADCTTYSIDYNTYSSTFSTVLDFSENVVRMYNGSKVLYLFTDSQYIGLGNYNYDNRVPSSISNVILYGVGGVKSQAYTAYNGDVIGYFVSIGNNSLIIDRIRCIRDRSCSGGLTSCYDPYTKIVNGSQSCYSAGNSVNYFTLDGLVGFGSNADSNPNLLTYTDYASNDDFYFQTSSGYSFKWEYNWEDVYPSAVADSRLKLDTIISSGRKELVVDMSAFCDDLYASSFNISDFVLTLNYDGTEQTFDDLGDYITIVASSTGYDCFAIIPYTEFGFDDNNNISDISVSVTKVSFSTNALYPNRPTVTESFQIATSYYLKNDLDNNIDWDDTNVTEGSNETIQYDGDDFNDLKISMENPEMQDHGTIYNDWHYVSSLPVWEGWESIYNVDIFTFADSLNVEHTWYHVRADFDSSLVQNFGLYYYVPFKISNWLYDNAISNYYDVLVFKNYHGKYEDVDITAPDDYLIFYSNRYYLKRHILELGNVHKTISSIGNQIFTLYDFTYKRMNDINGNIQKGFENVLSKDNAIIGLLSSVNFNLDKFGNMINSNLVSVVSGINGLKGSDDRDLTDIYNRLGNMITSVDLTGILSNLFVPTYTGFQDSFDDAIESMGILALPFDVSKRFITASRVPYSSTLNVTFPEYEFNNLQYWDEYEFEFNPNSILSADWLEFLQYCNALFVIVTVTLLTYKHIFASPVSEESGIL